jgi:Mg-chelatase subunit ChlD
MSVGVTPVDAAGKPVPADLPPASQLTSILALQDGATTTDPVRPFYASAGGGIDAGQHASIVLLMIDISGSMNDPSPGAASRFEAVKSAVSRYVNAMQEGSDEISIVPFESHNVVPTIRSAVFSSRKADVLAQLKALPSPGPKNNTALFQAVFTGVETMKAEVANLEHDGRSAAELQPHVIVMTDGKNEVMAGDDPQLLNGPLGLQQASEQVTTAHIDVVGIGFGDRTAIDANALQRLSTRFFYAADADQLLAALHVTHTPLSHVIQMTWLLGASNLFALAGRDQVWTPLLTLGGHAVSGDPQRIVFPAMVPPLYQRVASPAELVALIAVHPSSVSGWSTVLVHLLILVGCAALLLLLWFWIPRLVWGDREALAQAPKRWRTQGHGVEPDRHSVRAASGVQIRSAPAGFSEVPEAVGPLQRSPAQTTRVGPKTDATRSRLDFT